MKKILFILILSFLLPTLSAIAAGTVTQSVATYTTGSGYSTTTTKVVTLAFTGDATDGSVPDTTISTDLKGYTLYSIEYYFGTTAPDAANITIKNARGLDLAGGKGTGLITADTNAIIFPHSVASGLYFYAPINSVLTVAVAGQDTVDATWVIVLTFK